MIEIVLNKNGNKKIIEFFDYNCIHCKRQHEIIKKLLEKRKDVIIILKPLNILGEKSLYANQIGHAIHMMDIKKYEKFLNTIMDRHNKSQDILIEAIKTSGIDMDELKEVLKSRGKEIDDIIDVDTALAEKLKVDGTPAFYINKNLIFGEQSIGDIEEEIDKEF